MVTAADVKKNILSIIFSVCEDEANKIENDIMRDYSGINVNGKADTSHLIKQYAQGLILMSVMATGQKAVIAEYGKGSLMDRDNPALEAYFREVKDENGNPLFNRERLKHDLAIMTRPLDESYADLDKRVITRNPPKHEYNLEKTGDKRFQPVSPKYVVKQAVEQRLPIILNKIAEEIAVESEVERLFDNLQFTVNL